MVRLVTQTDTLSEHMITLTELVKQVADRPPVVIPEFPKFPEFPEFPAPPKQPVSLVADIIRGEDGKMTRVVVTPNYGA